MYDDVKIDKEKMFRDKEKMFTTNDKKFRIIIIVLAVVITFLIGFICYDKFYLDKNVDKKIVALDKKYKESNEELAKQKENNAAFEVKIQNLEKELNKKPVTQKNYIISNGSPYVPGFEDVHVYAVFYQGVVFAQDGKMYMENNVTNNSELNFEYSRSDADIYNTKIKESDILKVKIFQYPSSTTADNVAYFIYKNGRIKEIQRGDGIRDNFVFGKYKVKDINIECGKKDKYTGKCSGKYILTLKDGTTKVFDKVE